MIAIVDVEGAGAPKLMQALSRAGLAAGLAASQGDFERAERIILADAPDFAAGLRRIRDHGWIRPLLHTAADRPILGIGHGLHLLCDVSHEDGQHTGLGLIHGKALRLDPGNHPAARHFGLPHRGWNQVLWQVPASPLLTGLSSGEYFYFDHSAHAEPLDPAAIRGRSNHGVDFASVVQTENLYGVQFLPERSEEAGLKILVNFAAL